MNVYDVSAQAPLYVLLHLYHKCGAFSKGIRKVFCVICHTSLQHYTNETRSHEDNTVCRLTVIALSLNKLLLCFHFHGIDHDSQNYPPALVQKTSTMALSAMYSLLPWISRMKATQLTLLSPISLNLLYPTRLTHSTCNCRSIQWQTIDATSAIHSLDRRAGRASRPDQVQP